MGSILHQKCSGTLLINTFLAWVAFLNAAFLYRFNAEPWQQTDSIGLESNLRSLFLLNHSQRRLWPKMAHFRLKTQCCYGLFKSHCPLLIPVLNEDLVMFILIFIALYWVSAHYFKTKCSVITTFMCLLSRDRCVTPSSCKYIIHNIIGWVSK